VCVRDGVRHGRHRRQPRYRHSGHRILLGTFPSSPPCGARGSRRQDEAGASRCRARAYVGVTSVRTCARGDMAASSCLAPPRGGVVLGSDDRFIHLPRVSSTPRRRGKRLRHSNSRVAVGQSHALGVTGFAPGSLELRYLRKVRRSETESVRSLGRALLLALGVAFTIGGLVLTALFGSR
jgi:hypothetical protein